MIKVTDYIAEFLAQHGLRHVFLLTGGGAMHLNDSLGKHPKLEVVCNHHEQASAMAAESYARLCGKMAVVNVTTGPGAINTLNGVFGAWTDSIPMLILSGQVRYDTTVDSSGLPLRQLGDQECRIINMVEGITKYAVTITKPEEIKYHLQKAVFLATHGRPGPVWLDLPMNVQGGLVDEKSLMEFDAVSEQLETVPKIPDEKIQHILNKIAGAKRPVILAGSGIRLSKSHAEFLVMINQLKIPVVTAWNAHDVLPDDHPYHCGKPGTVGDRSGNFAVQNADVLIVLGCRLNIRQISYNWKSFAREAYKIIVDIDPYELKKPTVNANYPIHGDVGDLIKQLKAYLKTNILPDFSDWIIWCQQRKVKYPVVLKEYWDVKTSVNPYCFMQFLGAKLPEDQIIVSGNGTACVVSFQALPLKKGQRLYTNSGCASMGYDLPAAIGACVASGGKRIICLAGDGSIQQNIQELAMIVYKKYPIKIFVLNNNGYHSIRQTQGNFFGTPFVGVGPESGLGFPEIRKIAEAYGLPYVRCDQHSQLENAVTETLKSDEPVVCEVILDLNQQFAPKLSSKRLEDGRMISSPLEDLAPFLSREELESNMIIPLMNEK